MPTVYPPQSFDLEFTEKFEPFAPFEIPPPIGVNRVISMAGVVKTAVTALVRRMFKYRQRSGQERAGPVVGWPHVPSRPWRDRKRPVGVGYLQVFD